MDEQLIEQFEDHEIEAALALVAELVDSGVIDDIASDLTGAQVRLAERIHIAWTQLDADA